MSQAAQFTGTGTGPRPGGLLPGAMNHFASATAILFLARLVGAGMGFLVQMLLAKMFAPVELGEFFFALSIATIAAVFATMGYPSLAGRMASRRAYAGSKLDDFLKTALVQTFFVALGVSLVLLAGFSVAGFSLSALFLIAAIPCLALGPLMASALNLSRRNLAAFLPDLFFRPAMMLSFLGISLAAGLGWGLASVSGTYLAVAIAIVLVQTSALAGTLRPAVCVNRRSVLSAWRRSALPLAFVTVFTSFYPDISIVAAGFFLSSSDLAVFAIAMKISYLVGFANQISQQVAIPEMAGALTRRDAPGLRRAYLRASVFPGTVTAMALIGCQFFGQQILAFFGPEYVTGHSALMLLLGAQLARTLVGPIGQFAIVAGEIRPLILVLVPATALLLASLAVFAPAHGVTGAAACVSAYLLWPVLLGFVLRKRV
jgi:O-antigen/teichoic acid export membrane protein